MLVVAVYVSGLLLVGEHVHAGCGGVRIRHEHEGIDADEQSAHDRQTDDELDAFLHQVDQFAQCH